MIASIGEQVSSASDGGEDEECQAARATACAESECGVRRAHIASCDKGFRSVILVPSQAALCVLVEGWSLEDFESHERGVP